MSAGVRQAVLRPKKQFLVSARYCIVLLPPVPALAAPRLRARRLKLRRPSPRQLNFQQPSLQRTSFCRPAPTGTALQVSAAYRPSARQPTFRRLSSHQLSAILRSRRLPNSNSPAPWAAQAHEHDKSARGKFAAQVLQVRAEFQTASLWVWRALAIETRSGARPCMQCPMLFFTRVLSVFES